MENTVINEWIVKINFQKCFKTHASLRDTEGKDKCMISGRDKEKQMWH